MEDAGRHQTGVPDGVAPASETTRTRVSSGGFHGSLPSRARDAQPPGHCRPSPSPAGAQGMNQGGLRVPGHRKRLPAQLPAWRGARPCGGRAQGTPRGWEGRTVAEPADSPEQTRLRVAASHDLRSGPRLGADRKPGGGGSCVPLTRVLAHSDRFLVCKLPAGADAFTTRWGTTDPTKAGGGGCGAVRSRSRSSGPRRGPLLFGAGQGQSSLSALRPATGGTAGPAATLTAAP